MNKRLLYIFIIACTAMSCVKDKPNTPDTPVEFGTGRKFWINNEGSLGNGNASLSLYNIDKDSVYNDIYASINNQQLGDVFQSMMIHGDQLFMAINNSDKITVVNKNDLKLSGNITLNKPRYMLQVGADKMYVSSLYFPEINIVNTATLQVTGKITTNYANTEGMTMLNGKVYVCNWDTACNYIYEIDPVKDSITAHIPIAGYAGQQVLADKNNKLWVLAGNVYKNKTATLTQIDPVSRSIIKSFTLPAGADVMKPCWNPTKDTLYFLGVNYNGGTDYNGVYRMSINDVTLPGQLFIQAQALQYYWALGVDPNTNLIYLGDPKGFIQKGNISVYQTNGQKIKSFDVGLGPSGFLFE